MKIRSYFRNKFFYCITKASGCLIALSALSIIIALICLSAKDLSAKDLKAKDLNVVASIFPLQEFAKAAGGERVKVDLLLPPGAEPHTWEPRPSDIVTITKADIFIYIGAGMEPWIKDILEGTKHGSLTVIEASDGLDLIEDKDILHSKHNHHHSRGVDPHIWLDFHNDQMIIDKIVGIFCLHDPEGTKLYQQNGMIYKEKLSELDKRYTEGLMNCKGSDILFGGHSAFAYLARRYGLHQIPLYGTNPDAEPSPREMAEIVDIAKKRALKPSFLKDWSMPVWPG